MSEFHKLLGRVREPGVFSSLGQQHYRGSDPCTLMSRLIFSLKICQGISHGILLIFWLHERCVDNTGGLFGNIIYFFITILKNCCNKMSLITFIVLSDGIELVRLSSLFQTCLINPFKLVKRTVPE